MKAYILSIAGIILISAVVTIILPNGKMGKFIRGTVGLLILVVMISPLIGWVNRGAPTVGASAVIETDETYLTYCAEILERRDRTEIVAYISENFGVSSEVDVSRSVAAMFGIEKIVVKVTEEGINGDAERINIMTRIQAALEERYGCLVEVT